MTLLHSAKKWNLLFLQPPANIWTWSLQPPAPESAGQRSLRGLDFSRFARHYSGNKVFIKISKVTLRFGQRLCRNFSEDRFYVFSFPPATEMFHFAGLSTSNFATGGWPVFNRPGFPIRRSAGQRLLATSPQLIAGCYVLHRLLMSRHPPYTLTRFSHTFISNFKKAKIKVLDPPSGGSYTLFYFWTYKTYVLKFDV